MQAKDSMHRSRNHVWSTYGLVYLEVRHISGHTSTPFSTRPVRAPAFAWLRLLTFSSSETPIGLTSGLLQSARSRLNIVRTAISSPVVKAISFPLLPGLLLAPASRVCQSDADHQQEEDRNAADDYYGNEACTIDRGWVAPVLVWRVDCDV